MKTVNILLVEDNEGDIYLTREAFSELKVPVELVVVHNGEEAILYLDKIGNDLNVEAPVIILMDINLPKISGIEVLKYVKENQKLKHIPVIMLTTSSSKSDIMKSYRNHVNSYITKPIDLDEFMNVVSSIEHFWLHTNQLPPQ
jgi:CheY-like chemotaxis protein